MRLEWYGKTGWVVAAILVVTVLASCTSSEVDDSLPPYTHKEVNGAVRIDVGGASAGSAELGTFNQITLSFEQDDIAFGFNAFSKVSGLGRTSLQAPPIKISPVLTPGDGVADFFAAVWIDGETDELRYDLFLDTDWQDVVDGDISIHTQEFVDRRIQLNRIPIDFSEAARGVYHKELTFTQSLDYPRSTGPWAYVTNIPGDTKDFMGVYSTLDGLQTEHVVVSFGGGGCAEEITGAPGLGSDVRLGSSSFPKEGC